MADQVSKKDPNRIAGLVVESNLGNGETVTAYGDPVTHRIFVNATLTDVLGTDLEGGGKVSVGTTAVEVTFTGAPVTGATKSIIITADPDNAGTLYVGKSDVETDGSNALTFLKAGEHVTISYNDADNAIYVVASEASQNFWKGAVI